jgi:hypothetical protein
MTDLQPPNPIRVQVEREFTETSATSTQEMNHDELDEKQQHMRSKDHQHDLRKLQQSQKGMTIYNDRTALYFGTPLQGRATGSFVLDVMS